MTLLKLHTSTLQYPFKAMKGQASHRPGDNTGKYIADKEPESRIYKEFLQLNRKDLYPKNKQKQKYLGRIFEQTSHQKRFTNGK